MKLEFIEARDLSDAWFQCIYRILEVGKKYTIDRGSYEGQQRLEFDYITVHIKHPGVRPLLPDIPPYLGIPNPVADGYLEEYLPYLMTSMKQPNEDYTYGQRLTAGAILYDQKSFAPYDVYGGEVDQIQTIIDMYKKHGPGTNQMILQVAQPGDVLLKDSPCLRHIDTRISEGRLHFFPYFRCLGGSTPIIAKVNGELITTTVEVLSDVFNKGDKVEVISVDGELNPLWGDVVGINSCIKNNVVSLDIFGAGKIELTEDHLVPIYVNNTVIEKKVKDLKPKDVLMEHKFLSNIREYTNDYIDLLDILRGSGKIYVSDLSLNDFKKLNEDNVVCSSSFKDKRHLPFDKAYSTFLYDRYDITCHCQKQRNIHRMFKISEEMAYFMGLWLADGWYNIVGNALRLVVESSNILKLQRVIRFLKSEFNYIPTTESRPGCVVINISILFLAELFKSLGFIHGSKIKIIPQIIFNFPEKLLEEFFIGWFSGDSGVSSSSGLINGFSTILKFLDERFSIYTEKPRKVFFKKEDRMIVSSASQRILPLNYKSTRLDINDSLIGRKIKNISKFSSEKIVYDIVVDTKSHLFFCGQVPILVHNSWDLWNGFSANLGAIQLLKEYMSGEIGVGDGEIIASSKGLHLYDYVWELAKLRTMKNE